MATQLKAQIGGLMNRRSVIETRHVKDILVGEREGRFGKVIPLNKVGMTIDSEY